MNIETLGSAVAPTYSRLLSEAGRYLKSEGFTRRGHSFLLETLDGWAFVAFQKSRKSTPTEILFTINLGVASRRLLEFFADGSDSIKLADAHWRVRVGYLLPEQRDVWWTIGPSTKSESLFAEIELALSRAVAEVKRHLDDQVLRDMWSSERSPGLTDLQRLMHLSVLLKIIGPADDLAGVLAKLRESDHGGLERIAIRQHLKRFGDLLR
jgi:Domain of unknown function (DUF4304)